MIINKCWIIIPGVSKWVRETKFADSLATADVFPTPVLPEMKILYSKISGMTADVKTGFSRTAVQIYLK